MVHSACESGMTPRTMGGGSWWSGHAIHMRTSTGAMAAMLRSKAEGIGKVTGCVTTTWMVSLKQLAEAHALEHFRETLYILSKS
jgi:hypothetical protein